MHINVFGDSGGVLPMARRLHDAGHPLAACVVISDVGLANALADVTTVIFRQVWDGRERFNNSVLNGMSEAQAIAYGRSFFNGEHHGFNAAANKAQYLQLNNESGFHPLDYAFALGLMMEADAQGRKVAIFADSVGTPDTGQWQQRIPALRYAMSHNHIVCLHEYGPFVNGKVSSKPVSSPDGFEWYGGRHRGLYAAVPADCRPKLIVGECGPSDATFRGAEPLVSDAREYNRLLQFDSYVQAFCWYHEGGSGYDCISPARGQVEALAVTL